MMTWLDAEDLPEACAALARAEAVRDALTEQYRRALADARCETRAVTDAVIDAVLAGVAATVDTARAEAATRLVHDVARRLVEAEFDVARRQVTVRRCTAMVPRTGGAP